MLVPKPLGKFVAIFRGDVSPWLVLLSAALGFWFGLTPGWYGIHVVLLVAVLVLNVHLGIFLIFVGFGKTLCYAAAPVLYYVGKWTQAELGPVLDFFASLPIVGVTDFSRYSVAGALVLGPTIGLLCGLLLARSVHLFRRAWLTLEENSDAFRKWNSNRWVRLLDRLLLGKRTKDVRKALKRRTKPIRLAGVALAAVVLIASAVGLHFIQGDRLAEYASAALTQANGAEVNLARLDLAVLSGRVSGEGIQAANPQDLSTNRIAIAELVADASLWDLARGKLVVDHVALKGVAFDQPRATPTARAKTAAKPVEAGPPTAPPFDAQSYKLSDADVAKLRTYFKNAREVDEWLQRLNEWLPEREAEREPAPAATPQRYLEYVTARAPTAPTPRFVVRQAVLDDVNVPVEYVGQSTVECANLSDAPLAAGLPVTVSIRSKQYPTELKMVCRYDEPDGGAEITGHIGDIDLAKLQSALNANNAIIFEGGTAEAEISGTVSRHRVDLALRVTTHDIRARGAGKGVFGLDPNVTDEAMKVLENLQTNLRIVGPTTEPRLAFDAPSLTGEFRTALVNAGKAELASRLDTLVGDQVPGGVPDVGQVVEDPLGAASGVLADLSKKKDTKDEAEEDKGEEEEEEEEEQEEEQKKKDPLSRLKDKLKKNRKP